MKFFSEIFLQIGKDISGAWSAFLSVWFIVLPIVLYPLFKRLWVDRIQDAYASTIDMVLLEIIPPQNIEKSPKIMESIYTALAGILATLNVFEEFLDGRFTNKFSFEMTGEAGVVHLYIFTPKAFRSLVESHLYAQYPDVEIREVPDYVQDAPAVAPNREWDIWGTDFQLVGPDPLPIRTYDYFEEDITGKMIDPMAGIIEALGKVGPNQKVWFQMVIIPLFETWSQEGHELVEELAGRKKKIKKKGIVGSILGELLDAVRHIGGAFFRRPEWEKKSETAAQDPLDLRLTPGERKALEALEANIGKNVFSVKMRFVYLGKRENFTKSVVSSFIGALKQFADMNLNSFKPYNRSKTYANFIFRESRLKYRQRMIYRRYRSRDREGKTFILSTKELASIFHMPDMAVQSPYLQRVGAKKGGAPGNLPVQ